MRLQQFVRRPQGAPAKCVRAGRFASLSPGSSARGGADGLTLAEAKEAIGTLSELASARPDARNVIVIDADAEREAVRAQVTDILRSRARRAMPSRAGGFGPRLGPLARSDRALDAATRAVLAGESRADGPWEAPVAATAGPLRSGTSTPLTTPKASRAAAGLPYGRS